MMRKPPILSSHPLLRSRLATNTNTPAPSEPFRVPEEVDESEHLYPPRIKTKVSDFTKRVRDADDKSF
jgi:hypothetical protein